MRRFAVCGFVLAACAGPSPVSSSSRPPQDQEPPASRAPHLSEIVEVVLSPDGAAALTVDDTGALRLWPSLDGVEEPIVLPVRGARQLSLARARDGSITVGLVDGVGAGHVLTVRAGRVHARAQLAPLPPLHSLTVVAGGARLVALGRDRVITLVDPDGKRLARLEAREFRPDQLCASDAGDGLLAVSATAIRRVVLDGQALAMAGEDVSVPAPVDALHRACSPDGRRLAFLRSVPKAVGARGLVPPVLAAELVVVGPTGVEWRQPVPTVEARVGFVTDEDVVYSPRFGAAQIASKTGARAAARLTTPGVSAPSGFARRRWVVALGGALRIAELQSDGSFSAAATFGYDAIPADLMALSPSGRHLAWVSSTGDIFVETVGGEASPSRLRARARWFLTRALFQDRRQPIALGFVGETRLVVGGSNGELVMVDVDSGAEIAHAEPKKGLIRQMLIQDGLVYVSRHEGEGDDAVVYELDPARGFLGPYLFAGKGGDGAGVGGSGDGRIVWHQGPNREVKLCDLGKLRANRCYDASVTSPRTIVAVDASGGRWEYAAPSPTTIERVGEGPPRRLVLDGPALKGLDGMPPSGASIAFSPGGDAAVLWRDGTLLAVDVPSGAPRFSAPSGQMPAFSGDGARLAVALTGGVAVLDAKTGAILHRRCGAGFGPIDAESAAASGRRQPFGATPPGLCE